MKPKDKMEIADYISSLDYNFSPGSYRRPRTLIYAVVDWFKLKLITNTINH